MKATQESRADRRFLAAVTMLLRTMPESEVMTWLLEPCRCLDCQESVEKPPRAEMVNAEVSFRHLMKEIKDHCDIVSRI